MTMQGNLQIMSVADLIQHNCQGHTTAQLVIQHNNQEATLFFKGGAVLHATLGNLQGEKVVYEILKWEEGQFNLETDVEPAATTISRTWSGLLLEGARRLDHETNFLSDDLTQFNQEDFPMATSKKKGELLADALTQLLNESSDIAGAAIVGVDGLVYSANVPQKGMDESLVGATSAAVFGLSTRRADQLQRGVFKQTLIQGEDGNVIVASIDNETLFVGLTANGVNLGMAFAEVRTMTTTLKDLL